MMSLNADAIRHDAGPARPPSAVASTVGAISQGLSTLLREPASLLSLHRPATAVAGGPPSTSTGSTAAMAAPAKRGLLAVPPAKAASVRTASGTSEAGARTDTRKRALTVGKVCVCAARSACAWPKDDRR